MIVKYFNWYKNFSERKLYLQRKNKEFIVKQGFSTAEIHCESKKMRYTFERIPKYYLGYRSHLLSCAKNICGGDYDWTMVFKRLDGTQRQIYKNSVLQPFGFYIDMKNAYTTILHILGFIPQETFIKLLNLKEKGHNINRILGISYLGKKSVITYYGFKELEEKLEINPATGIFYLAKYLIYKLFTDLRKDEMVGKQMIARFIDCCLVLDKYTADEYINRIRWVFTNIFLSEIKKINDFVYKNCGFSLFDKMKFILRDDFYKFFQFHTYRVTNLKYSESGNTRVLEFYVWKNNTPIKRIYKSGALSETPLERFSFSSSGIFKTKESSNFDNVQYIDIYQVMDKLGLNYEILNIIENNKENIPIIEQKINNFIEEYNFKMIDYEGISDITTEISVDF